MAKILIVDDDVDTAKRMAHELQQVGHECATRSEGTGLLEIARKSEMDLLILDVMLPGTSGFEICRQIRSDEELFLLPILFVSSMSDDAEVQHGLEQGADGFITKPLDSQSFVERINRLIKMSKDGDYIDAVTQTPDADGMRRLIQQHITRDDSFGLVYIELLHIKEFTERTNAEARDKALRHLARALHHYAESMSLTNYVQGHMGGGHFIALIPFERTAEYCEKILATWQQHMKTFYANDSLPVSYSDAEKRGELLDLSICVTSREKHDHISAQQMLDTVSRMHKIAYTDGLSGIHIDRRS